MQWKLWIRQEWITHLKKFLNIFAGDNLLPPGVEGVEGVTLELFETLGMKLKFNIFFKEEKMGFKKIK